MVTFDADMHDRGPRRVTIRRSKADQEGEGVTVAVLDVRRLKPVAHLKAWLGTTGIVDGPVFRPLWKERRVRDARLSDHSVAHIVQAGPQ